MTALSERTNAPEATQRDAFHTGYFVPGEISVSPERKEMIKRMFERRKEALDELANY